ncbi:MAG: hypothetical protein JXA93_04775 [Anaerolineae bacterium]|nr:hypothetical protein [Anaerolineae bacterium]
MLYLDERSAEVYADMRADLEAERVGHRVPVYRPAPGKLAARFQQLRGTTRRLAVGLRCRVLEWYARAARPQEQCC